MFGREPTEREDVGAGIVQHCGDLRVRALEHPGDLIELGLDVSRVGLGEDGADDRGNHVLAGTRDDGEHISHEVNSAALPRGTLEHCADGLLQTAVRVGDDELDTVQPARLQRPKELGPEDLVLAVTDVETEDFAAPVGGHSDGDDHRLGDDAVVDAGLAIRGVEEHIGVAGNAEVTATECADFVVEISANPRHLRLGDAGISAERLDQISDLPSRDAVKLCLHHNGEQGLINAAAPLKEGGEERPLAQLGHLQIQVAGRRRQDARTSPVALGGAVIGAFESAGADVRGGLRIDEFLVESFGHHADSIGDIGQLEFREEREQGRLV